MESDIAPPLLFSRRYHLAKAAEAWCLENGAATEPLNIVTALHSMGVLNVELIRSGDFVDVDDDGNISFPIKEK